jgi:CHAP domain
MSQLDDVLSRVSQLEQLFGQSVNPTVAPTPASTATPASTSTSFATALASAMAPAMYDTNTAPTTADGSTGSQVLAAAESQLGVTEQPPGSNDGPQIATYRSAVAGSAAGEPWCAYFASWAAAQAGEPLGANGQGLGSVAEITQWASQTGRLLPASATPTPGDLILFGDHHVGIVESVQPDGSLTTVEGNYSNGVNRVHRAASEATGYVAL